MNVMNDSLPQSNTTPPPVPSGSMAKETGPHITFAEAPLIHEVGQELPLSNEVAKAGVTIQPTTVELPPSIGNMGVNVVGSASVTAVVTLPSEPLPLTDEQIAKGLHESIQSSWRWLSEWCDRQLKQAHVLLKTIHGKIVRLQA